MIYLDILSVAICCIVYFSALTTVLLCLFLHHYQLGFDVENLLRPQYRLWKVALELMFILSVLGLWRTILVIACWEPSSSVYSQF